MEELEKVCQKSGAKKFGAGTWKGSSANEPVLDAIKDIKANTMETISAELSRIDPSAFPDVETVTLENGKSVIALRVSEGGGLYTYDDRPYIRTGPTTRVMTR